MNHFEYSSNTSYGKMILPLRTYKFLAHIEATMVGGFAEIELKIFYRIIDSKILEFAIGAGPDDDWEYSIVGRFHLKEPFYSGLLEQYLRLYIMEGRNYLGLSYEYHESPMISKSRFQNILDDIFSDLQIAQYNGQKRWGNSSMVRLCKERRIEIYPTSYDHIMECKCPAGNHRLTFNAETGSWFCGYCGKNGHLEELEAHLKTYSNE